MEKVFSSYLAIVIPFFVGLFLYRRSEQFYKFVGVYTLKPVIITTVFWMMMVLMIMNITGLVSAFFLPTLLSVALTIIIISWYRDLYTDENKKYFVFPILLDTLRWGSFLTYLSIRAPIILNITLFISNFFAITAFVIFLIYRHSGSTVFTDSEIHTTFNA
jgi:hypothetical protein